MARGGLVCGSCGVAAPVVARFCMSCGSPLTALPTVQVRKTVTALCCDIAGSTMLAQTLDPEVLRGVVESWFGEVRSVLERHGGTVEKFVGDAVMAVFGAPVAHEDDALRACRAALEILERTAAAGRFHVRVGVETGEVAVGDVARGSTFASGIPVILAARLQAAAAPGEALVGPGCLRMVEDRVVTRARRATDLKNVAEPVDVGVLIAVDDVRDDVVRPSWPLVGRRRELALLRETFDRSVGERTCRLATVIGVAGMGKSRLTEEFVSAVSSVATVLRGRCLSYGEGVTFWPLVQVVQEAAGLQGSEGETAARARVRALVGQAADADEIVTRLAPAAGLGGLPGPPEDTAWAFRRLLEELSRRRPVVVSIDDLHWAEPGLLAVVQEVVDWLSDVPVLVLVLARPEFLDENPGWGMRRPDAVNVELEPLDFSDSNRLAAEVLGAPPPAALTDRLRKVAGGNPLYVEQLVAMLVDEGVLRRDADGEMSLGEGGEVRMPPTVAALIAARLDRLPSAERTVLGAASVMGLVFYRDAVARLTPVEHATEHLSALMRKHLVKPSVSDLPGRDALRFDHVLVREASYAAMSKAARADLHEKFARWLQDAAHGRAVDDLLGTHLATAHQLLTELGGAAGRRAGLGEEAAQRFEAAGRLQLYADDRSAAAFLERADQLRHGHSIARWDVRLELVRSWRRELVRLPDAAAMAEDVLRAAESAGSLRWALLARLELACLKQLIDPKGATDLLRREAEDALRLFTEMGDHHGISQAHMARSNVANNDWRPADDVRAVTLAARHSDLAGRAREARFLRFQCLNGLAFDDTPAHLALEACRSALEEAETRAQVAFASLWAGMCSTLLGHAEEGEEFFTRAREHTTPRREHPLGTFVRSQTLLAVGDWASAGEQLSDLCDQFTRSGAVSLLSTFAAQHGLTLLFQGDVARAHDQIDRATELGAADDVATQAFAHAGQAWLAAVAGDAAEVVRHMRLAAGLPPPDVLLDLALVHIAGAEAFHALGQTEEEVGHRQRAVELYAKKGNVVGAAWQRQLLGQGSVP